MLYEVITDLLGSIETSKEFKRMIVENFMSQSQLDAVEQLTVESINSRLLASKNVKLTASKIHKEIIALVSSFSWCRAPCAP